MTTWDEHGRPDDDDVDWLTIPVSGYPLPVRDTTAAGAGALAASGQPTDLPVERDTQEPMLDS